MELNSSAKKLHEALKELIVSNQFGQNETKLTTESFPSWFYRKIVLRIHFVLFFIFLVLFATQNLIVCKTNIPLSNKMNQEMCLYSGTFIYRNKSLENDLGIFGSVLTVATVENDKPEYQWYYLGICFVLLIQVCLNFVQRQL